MQYYQLPQLENIYLEDSFVTGIYKSNDALVFNLDVVLTESHPNYEKPLDGEAYCYKRAKLVFPKISNIEWTNIEIMPSIDVNKEVDFGNIDTFVFNNNEYHLTGGWGEVNIKSEPVNLYFI